MPFGWFRRKKKEERRAVEPIKTTREEPVLEQVEQEQRAEEKTAIMSRFEDSAKEAKEFANKIHSILEAVAEDPRVLEHHRKGAEASHYYIVEHAGDQHIVEILYAGMNSPLTVRIAHLPRPMAIEEAVERLRAFMRDYYDKEFDAKMAETTKEREDALAAMKALNTAFMEHKIPLTESIGKDRILEEVFRKIAEMRELREKSKTRAPGGI